MAGDWIPATKSLSRKREVMSIASATSRSRYEVVGFLLDFWSWVDDESADGLLPGMTPDQLPGLFSGTDAAFWSAVISAGWLIQRTTSLEVPNFQRWLGQSAKRRLKDTERKRQQRKEAGMSAESVRKMSASEADKSGTTEQKRTEEKRRGGRHPPNPPQGGSDFPASLDTPKFREVWACWERYRAEKRKKLSASTRIAQLVKLEAWGEEKAIAALEQSILHGWIGIFDPDDKSANGQKPKPGTGFQEAFRRTREEQQCRQSGTSGQSTTPPSSP